MSDSWQYPIGKDAGVFVVPGSQNLSLGGTASQLLQGIQDVTLSFDRTEISLILRGTENETVRRGVKKATLTIKAVVDHTTTASLNAYDVLSNAYNAPDTYDGTTQAMLGLAITDSKDLATGNGFKGDFVVTKMSEPQPVEGNFVVDFTLRPGQGGTAVTKLPKV